MDLNFDILLTKSKPPISTANIRLTLGLILCRTELAGRHNGQESRYFTCRANNTGTADEIELLPPALFSQLNCQKTKLKTFVLFEYKICSLVCPMNKKKFLQVTKLLRGIFLQILVQLYVHGVLNIFCVISTSSRVNFTVVFSWKFSTEILFLLSSLENFIRIYTYLSG